MIIAAAGNEIASEASADQKMNYEGWQATAATLVKERGDALIHYALLICGSADDAADLVQDALVKTFGRVRNGLTVISAEAYVRRSIMTTWLDRARHRTVWRRIAHLTATTQASPSASSAIDSRVDLLAQLDRLPPRQRACIVLRFYEDLTVDAIADWLGISAGAVKRYLSDGLRTMAIALSDAGAPPFASPEHKTGESHDHRN